jgi:sulfide:quinone oxidoreductase
LTYDKLILAAGIELDWGRIEGLRDTLGLHGVTSNYGGRELAEYTWSLIKTLLKENRASTAKFSDAKAVFTQPAMPIKCAGAPQKVVYLACDYWTNQQRNRPHTLSVDFRSEQPSLFSSVPDYEAVLQPYMDKYHVNTQYQQRLVKVDGPAQKAYFETKTALICVPFAMLHVVPPQRSAGFIRASSANTLLTDSTGFVQVHPKTLRHLVYADIYALGDIANTPNSKTASAIGKQSTVVANNLLQALQRGHVTELSYYNGYASCPIPVEYGKVLLTEFLYNGIRYPTFPAWLLEDTKPSTLAWFLNLYLVPYLYWNFLLKGRWMP